MYDGAEPSPRSPRSADAPCSFCLQVVEEARDLHELRGRHFAPGFDLLRGVDRAERPTALLEKERERVEERRGPALSHVGDVREETINGQVETGLLVGLPDERVADGLAVLDAARREAVRAARVEALDREEEPAARAADHHADLAEAVFLADRVVERVVDGRAYATRRPVEIAESFDLGDRIRRELHAPKTRSARACARDRRALRVGERPPSS